MEVQSPAGGADEPGNGHAAAMRSQLVSALAVAHLVLGSAPVELRAAFTKTEEMRISDQKRDGASFGIDRKLLNCLATCGLDGDSYWIKREFYAEFTDGDDAFELGSRESCCWGPPRLLYKGPVAT